VILAGPELFSFELVSVRAVPGLEAEHVISVTRRWLTNRSTGGWQGLYKRVEEEGKMLTHDYLFMVVFMVGVWYMLHAGRGHSLWH
jgi:hypothetical protein